MPKRRTKTPPPRAKNGPVAWLALVLATAALAISLSNHSWVRGQVQHYSENWDSMMEEIRASRLDNTDPAEETFS